MPRTRIVVLALLVLAACAAQAAAQNAGPVEGGPPPKIVLPAPKEAAEVAYLGLTSKKEFTPADIAAEVVIIQIFNMY